MKLNGKCKEEFENWYCQEQTYDLGNIYKGFYSRDMNMKYGVFVDFFASVGMDIIIERRRNDLFLFVIYLRCNYGTDIIPTKQTRQEARTKAIEKANEIYNK